MRTDGLRFLRESLRQHRHTALLVAIVIAFAARPLIGNRPAADLAFSAAVLLLMLAALYAIRVDELVGERSVLLRQRRRQSRVGVSLAAVAIATRVVTLVVHTPQLFTVAAVTWILFLAYVTWRLLLSVLRQREVTGETISMSISIYLLLGLTWGVLYFLIFQAQPNAFHFVDQAVTERADRLLPILLYFSLTCLSTIGFGDITPVTLQARYAAVAEGITGQFYLAILVARLVGLQMSHAASRAAQRD